MMGFSERLKAKNRMLMDRMRLHIDVSRREKIMAEFDRRTSYENTYEYATKYVDKHYGDVYRKTMKYDNDWG
jgi:hypothetical protein